MRLSDGVEWAIHCAAVLAGLPDNATMAAKDLAEFLGVSGSYLLKHLKLLVKSGLLISTSGPSGGFRLSRPAAEITLLQILEAVEGRFAPFRCTEIRQRGPVAGPLATYKGPCHIHAAMREAEAAYRAVLESKTVAEIAGEVAATIPKDRLMRAKDWLEARARRTAKKKP